MIEWTAEAQALLGRAPVFVRSLARRKVEEMARQRGFSKVTAQLVEETKKLARHSPGGHTANQLSAAEIERIERDALTSPAAERRARTYEIKACGAVVGCPRSLGMVSDLADRVAKVIEASGLPDRIETVMSGRPILTHHRFRVAVDGCPNACSQPQIRDFGIIIRGDPAVEPSRCDGCGLCAQACQEGAMSLVAGLPETDSERCIGCADCVHACPTGALAVSEVHYRLLVGGKLGRHPRLADEWLTVHSMEACETALQCLLEILARERQPGQRITDALDATRLQMLRSEL